MLVEAREALGAAVAGVDVEEEAGSEGLQGRGFGGGDRRDHGVEG